MKKTTLAFALTLMGTYAFADMATTVGDKVDAASTVTKSKTDNTANPVQQKTNALGMEKTSKKVSDAAGTGKKKTDLGAGKIKKAVGAADTKGTETKNAATATKENAVNQAQKALDTTAK